MKRLLVMLILGIMLGLVVLPGVQAAWGQSFAVNGSITVVP